MLELIWPSKKKIKSLRLEGETLFSTAFFQTILLLTVIFVLSACATNFIDFTTSYLNIIADPLEDPMRIKEILNVIWQTLIFPTLIILSLIHI